MPACFPILGTHGMLQNHFVVAALMAALSGVIASRTVVAQDNLKAFPEADDGSARFVLQLPEKPDESLFKVELLVGKKQKLDELNSYFFGGKINSQTVEGWGFTKYVVSDLGPLAGTLIAVDPNLPKVDRFITLGGDPFLIRYNSKIPLVVYVPKDAEVRYRIWRTEPESQPVPRG